MRVFSGLPVAIAVVLGAALLYVFWLAPRGAEQSDGFTLGTAIVVAAYVASPALVLLAAGLLVVALLLVGGDALERRRRKRI